MKTLVSILWVCAIVVAGTGNGYAQAAFVDSGQTLGTGALALGDLDGDGDLDWIGAGVWFNDGNGLFGDSGQTLPEPRSVALGDLDGDGDLDAWVAGIYAPGEVWLNDGRGGFTDSGQRLGPGTPYMPDHVALGDLDDDGDLDAFVGYNSGGYAAPNLVWLNTGDGTYVDSGQALGSSATLSVALGDLDGDGDLDAWVANAFTPNRVWLNDGDGAFSDTGQTLGGSSNTYYSVALGDIDGDGDLDAWVAVTFGRDQLWLNNGRGRFSDSGQALSVGAGAGVALGDLDEDGDLDAWITTCCGEPAEVWLNDGGVYSDSGQRYGQADYRDVALGDVDGDGDLDAVVGDGLTSFGPSAAGTVWLNELRTPPCGHGYVLPANQWRLIAAPCQLDPPATVASAYGDDLPGAYGWRWILYEYDALINQYVALSSTDPIDPGVGTWLYSFDGGRLRFSGSATPAVASPGCPSGSGCYVIPVVVSDGIEPAQNMLGHPFAHAVNWADVRIRVDDAGSVSIYTPSEAEVAGILSKTFHVWSGNAYETYDDVTPGMAGTLDAHAGFWIKLLPGSAGKTVDLLIPAEPAAQTSQSDAELPWYLAWLDWLVPTARASESSTDAGEFYVRLTVTDAERGAKDANNVFGWLRDARRGYDRHDLMEMPPFGADYLTIVFPHPDWGEQAGDYASDFHRLPRDRRNGDAWRFAVRSGDPMRWLTLTWDGPAAILRRSVLIDETTGTRIPARDGRYEFGLIEQTHRFRWHIRRGR
jgi:hypothetical protein